jgi:hypothetical protein
MKYQYISRNGGLRFLIFIPSAKYISSALMILHHEGVNDVEFTCVPPLCGSLLGDEKAAAGGADAGSGAISVHFDNSLVPVSGVKRTLLTGVQEEGDVRTSKNGAFAVECTMMNLCTHRILF